MSGWTLRDYRPGDQQGVDALIDDDTEHLFTLQGHPLHGPARDGERWRRTLIAELDGLVIGAATVARNKWHPTYITLIVEVASAYRRRGLGTELSRAARDLHPASSFYTKIKEKDQPAMHFARSLGGEIIATTPMPRLDPTVPETASWLDAHHPPRGITLAPLSTLPASKWGQLWAAQYKWVHQAWNPADPANLDELGALAASEFDGEMSAIAQTSDGSVVAAAFASPFPDGVIVVVETIKRDAPDGQAAVAAVLAKGVRYIQLAGRTDARVDGHEIDKHLGPVLATMPASAPLDVLYGFTFRGYAGQATSARR